MRTVITFVAATVLAASAPLAPAQSDQDHKAHHPGGASAPAAVAKKPAAKTPAAKPKSVAPAASAASGGMDAADMKQMHDEKHKPGGMHDRMHGKDGPMKSGMPAASAAS
ncbi:MAG TPA: hypothetical protein VIN58_07540 [Roseateles sp.]